MAKSKAMLMKKLRDDRKKQGLVDYRKWVTQEEEQKLDNYLKKLRSNT
ncbi:hypothetical protein [Aliikangiella maris]|uniref:30S ribosomal protein S14 n=2 Tax=Aliikangiella maris TaxID=3162458 RepID=A0ABV2BZM1_9GAMM